MKRFSRVVIVATSLSLIVVGCGKDSQDDSGSGKTEVKKLGKPAQKLWVGTWVTQLEVDDVKLEELMYKQGIESDLIPKMMEMTKKKMKDLKVTINVKPDGTSELVRHGPDGKTKTDKSKWEVIDENGMVVKIKMIEKGKTTTDTLTFRNDNEYEFSTDNPTFKNAPFKTPIVFKRQK